MPRPLLLPYWLRKRMQSMRKLQHDTRGATMVEFAIVVIPFFAVLLASLTTSLVYFAQECLETTAEASARIIMTGEAQKAAMSQSQYQTKVCASLPAFMKCSNLYIDVQRYSSFSGANTTPPTFTFDANGKVTNSFSYTLGNAGDIVVVKLMYLWPIPAVNIGYDLSTTRNGQRLMLATAIAKTELYS